MIETPRDRVRLQVIDRRFFGDPDLLLNPMFDIVISTERATHLESFDVVRRLEDSGELDLSANDAEEELVQ